MYLIFHLFVYMCFIGVQELSEDDQDRSKYIGIMTNSL